MKKLSNILDQVKPTLPVDIWNSDNKLFHEHKEKILNYLYASLTELGYAEYEAFITEIKIIGSACSYQYNRKSDLDTHIFVDWDVMKSLYFKDKTDEEALDEVWAILDFMNKEHPLTLGSRPIEIFIETGLTTSVVESGIYNLTTDTWEREPKPINSDFDIEEFYTEIYNGSVEIMESMDINIGQIKRDVKSIDFLQETIEAWDGETQKIFKEKLENKLESLENEIQELIDKGEAVVEEKEKGYVQIGEGVIDFKTLQRYGYMALIKHLENLLEYIDPEEEITIEKVPEVKEIVKEMSLDTEALSSTKLKILYHGTTKDKATSIAKEGFKPANKWGHSGVFFTTELYDKMRGETVIEVVGDFKVAEVDDSDTGSAHIEQGYGNDKEYEKIRSEIFKKHGIPTPWSFGLRDKDKSFDKKWQSAEKEIKEYFHKEGYDGKWIGGEVIIWNINKLNTAKRNIINPNIKKEMSLDKAIVIIGMLGEVKDSDLSGLKEDISKVSMAVQVDKNAYYTKPIFNADTNTVEGYEVFDTEERSGCPLFTIKVKQNKTSPYVLQSLIKEKLEANLKQADYKRICQYCDKQYGTTPAKETGETHGICDECIKLPQEELDTIARRKKIERNKNNPNTIGSVEDNKDIKEGDSVKFVENGIEVMLGVVEYLDIDENLVVLETWFAHQPEAKMMHTFYYADFEKKIYTGEIKKASLNKEATIIEDLYALYKKELKGEYDTDLMAVIEGTLIEFLERTVAEIAEAGDEYDFENLEKLSERINIWIPKLQKGHGLKPKERMLNIDGVINDMHMHNQIIESLVIDVMNDSPKSTQKQWSKITDFLRKRHEVLERGIDKKESLHKESSYLTQDLYKMYQKELKGEYDEGLIASIEGQFLDFFEVELSGLEQKRDDLYDSNDSEDRQTWNDLYDDYEQRVNVWMKMIKKGKGLPVKQRLLNIDSLIDQMHVADGLLEAIVNYWDDLGGYTKKKKKISDSKLTDMLVFIQNRHDKLEKGLKKTESTKKADTENWKGYWITNDGTIYPTGKMEHADWIQLNPDIVQRYYKGDIKKFLAQDKIKSFDANDIIRDEMLENGWVRININKNKSEVLIDYSSTLDKSYIENLLVNFGMYDDNTSILLLNYSTGNSETTILKDFLDKELTADKKLTQYDTFGIGQEVQYKNDEGEMQNVNITKVDKSNPYRALVEIDTGKGRKWISEKDIVKEASNENIELTFTDECVGSHNGQKDMELGAWLKGTETVVGILEYGIFNNEIEIGVIKVKEEYRRKGIGTQIWNELKRLYPNMPIDIGMKTRDGTEFFKTVKAGKGSNEATFKGQPFWCGVVNSIDGIIEEVHTYEEARDNDFHHSFYFTDKGLDAFTEKYGEFFWIEGGKVMTYSPDSLSPKIKNKILEQITFINKKAKFTPTFFTNAPGDIGPSGFDYQAPIKTVYPENLGQPYAQLPENNDAQSNSKPKITSDDYFDMRKKKLRKNRKGKQPNTDWETENFGVPLPSTFTTTSDPGLLYSDTPGQQDSARQYAAPPMRKMFNLRMKAKKDRSTEV